jgi:hypothetical protein
VPLLAEANFNAPDTSGKSVASRHHREDCMARADSRRRAFLWPDASAWLFQFVEAVASCCQQFVYELETLEVWVSQNERNRI